MSKMTKIPLTQIDEESKGEVKDIVGALKKVIFWPRPRN